MRHSKQTADEIFTAEKAVDDRKKTRASGFSKMRERDQGWQRLDNGVVIAWAADRELRPGEVMQHIPDDKFILVIDGKTILFDTDEFRRWLRWA